MSKYIIELNDKCVRGIVVFGKTDEGVISTTQYIENLEVLNSDYINEHFGDLQDTAYQRGLNDAWEAARKTVDMWTRMDNDELLAIFGITERIGHSTINSLFGKQTANEVMLNLEAYEEKQEAADKIEVGDEVYCKDNDVSDSGVVTWVGKDSIYAMWQDGSAGEVQKDELVKTGRHFDIASILEDMRND